jgi:uncharacterized membrane protein
VVVLVLGLVGSAMAAPTIGRMTGTERRGRLTHTFGILGGLVAGLGVILFFAANWEDISRPLRVVILVAGILGFFAVGFLLSELRGTHPNIGHACIFLGTILYGASIFLVGQMYNVQAHDPLGFLLWSAGALAMALIVRSGPIAALGFLSLYAWLVHEVVDVSPEGDALVVLPAFLTLFGIALYGFGTGAARWLEPLRFTRPMRLMGFGLTAAGLFPYTFSEAHEYREIERAIEIDRVALILGCLAVAAVLGVITFAVLRWRDRSTAIGEAVVLLAVAALVLLAVLEPEVQIEGGTVLEDREQAEVYPILFNVLLGIVAFGAVIVGILANEVWLANAGAAAVGIDVLARVFDGEWSMLERGVVFMIAGAVVLAVAALFERRPRAAAAEP